MGKMPKELRKDLALQLASIIYEGLPFWKKWRLAKWYMSNGTDTKEIWHDCIYQASKMIDEADFRLDSYLEEQS